MAGAKALLDKFGYVDSDGDGWRDMPDGKPLKLTLASDPSAIYRQFDELWKKSMDAVGIRIEFTKQKFPDTLKQGLAGQLQMWGLANTNTNDNGSGFLDLLYGPHKGMSNLGRFDLPEFNALYDRAKKLPERPGARASSIARCRSSSSPTRRGCCTPTASRTSSCNRGSWATSTTRSIRIRGCTSTSTSRSASARRARRGPMTSASIAAA